LSTHIWVSIIAASQHTNKANCEGKQSGYTKDVSCRGETRVRLFKHNVFLRLTPLNIRRHPCERCGQLLSKGRPDNTKNQLPNVVVKSAVGLVEVGQYARYLIIWQERVFG